jgi:multiple sugar transport system substrate-binding protein
MAAEVNFVMVPISTGAPDLMRRLLDEFESISRIKVNVRLIDWLEQRTVMVDTAVHGRGADVFLMAVPQTSDLISMNALRPFTTAEVDELGGAESFLPASLRSGMRPGESQIWAIPWLIDTRVLFYWRDLLESAGLDGATAFKTCHQFDESFAVLKQHGFDIPFAPPYENYMVIHTISICIF